MVDRNAVLLEVCELLKVWMHVTKTYGGSGWEGPTKALIERINGLCDQLN